MSLDWTFDPALKGALPADFHFGYATAAAQVEGAWDVGGRGPSIWDTFSHTPGKVVDGSSGDDAVRSYDLYKQDVARMVKYGVTAYRFSLSWSRIIPLGGAEDLVSEEGIAYYNRLIDELLAHGITPFVTLFHWDLPQALEDRYGGLLDKNRYTHDFVRYATVCFERFGDRVKNWTTYNEPGVYSLAGYAAGVHAPARSSFRDKNEEGDSGTEPFIVGHTELVSHAYVCDLYKRQFQPSQHGSIMITLHGNWSEPWDENDPKDVEAAERAREFEIAWFGDPLYKTGDYPASMRAQLGDRLPHFTPEESRLVLGSSERYGMNSYSAFYIRHKDTPPERTDHLGNVEKLDTNVHGVERGPKSDTYWLRTTPWGWAKTIRWIWGRYHVPIYITENGTTAQGEHDWRPSGPDDVLEDPFRIDFFRSYLTEVAKASQEGVVIKSYFGWTFTDNFEWAAGYTDRFGVTWVDFDDPEKPRWPKRSAFFNHTKPTFSVFTCEVKSAAASSGFNASIPALLTAAKTNTAAAYAKVVGINNGTIAATQMAVKEAADTSYHIVYLVAIAFGVVAITAAFTVKGIDESNRTGHTAVRLEDDVVRREAKVVE